jgi:hypothetical protein
MGEDKGQGAVGLSPCAAMSPTDCWADKVGATAGFRADLKWTTNNSDISVCCRSAKHVFQKAGGHLRKRTAAYKIITFNIAKGTNSANKTFYDVCDEYDTQRLLQTVQVVWVYLDYFKNRHAMT